MHAEIAKTMQKRLFDVCKGIPFKCEGESFTPPADGSLWVEFHYIPADTFLSGTKFDCMSWVGIWQLSIHFQPGSGMKRAREVASLVERSIPAGWRSGKIRSWKPVRHSQPIHTNAGSTLVVDGEVRADA